MSFEESFAVAESIPGWLTRDQARVLHEAARAMPAGGIAVEIGSHHGRSTVVLARALPGGARLVAIDPFPQDWHYGAPGTEDACRESLRRAGVADRVDLRVSTSTAVRRAWQGPIDLLYVDGKHDVLSLRDDLRWTAYAPDGCVVLVHDAFSSIGVTLGLFSVLPLSRRLRYVGRTGSLARLEVRAPSLADRLRPLREVPWWLRNVVVKVLLRLRLRPLARLLGHEGAADPF